MQSLIKEKELMDWLDFKSRAALKKALEEQQIPIVYGKNNTICTTLELIASREQKEKEIRF